MRGKTVLIIDDDADLVEFVEHLFSEAGARVHTATNGRDALRKLDVCQPDLILLDVMMPALDGWQTCRQIRRRLEVPIIFVTAAARGEDVIRGLDLGAVDYVAKPFSHRVLLARARAALRATGAPLEQDRMTRYDDGYLRVDLQADQVSVDGVPVRLTSTEYRLFAYLFENAGQVLTHRQILAHVWGGGYEDATDYVHVYVSHLRRKLERDPRQPAYLLTERGVGYRLKLQPSDAPTE
jgi:two-component system KDP operon response regulator KdpE